jgi:hypothetical protein
MLTHPQQMELINLTKGRLAKMRRYVAPARPCNENRNLVNLAFGNDNQYTDHPSPCHQLINQIGSSWQARQASLLMAASKRQGQLN